MVGGAWCVEVCCVEVTILLAFESKAGLSIGAGGNNSDLLCRGGTGAGDVER